MSTKASDKALDFGRLKYLALGLLSVALALLGMDFVLNVTIGPLPVLQKRYQIDPDLLDLVGGKSEAIQSKTTESPDPLVLFLGASSVRLGLDSKFLEETWGVKWANLGVLGASTLTLQEHSLPIFQSGLKPDVVIVGIHPCWLGRRPEFMESSDKQPEVRFWMSKSQQILWRRYHRMLMFARMAVGHYRWPNELWTVEQKLLGKANDYFRNYQFGLVGARGYFTASNFHRRTEEYHSLSKLLKQVETLGAERVIVVLMPVHSRIRESVPEDALTLTLECIREAGVENVVDLRDAVSDEGFDDLFHVNESGKMTLSEVIGKRVYSPEKS